MLNLDKPLQTRDGDPAVLVYVGDNTDVLHRLLDAGERVGTETIVALVRGMFLGYDLNGKYISHQNNGCDLVNTPTFQQLYAYADANPRHPGYSSTPRPPSPDHERIKVTFVDGKITALEPVG